MDIRLHGSGEIAEALAENPLLCNALIADEALPTDQQVTMLWQAAAFGDTELLRLFCGQHGADVNFQRASDGVSALYVAAQNGHRECCRILLDHDARVNVQRHTKATPLFIAVQKSRTAIVQLLMDYGADQSIANDQNATPFVLACNMGLTDIALLLLQQGADVGDKGSGLTGLGWCRREGKLDTLRALQLHCYVIPQQRLRERVALLIYFEQWMKLPARMRAEREAAQRARDEAREALLRGGALPSLAELADVGGAYGADFVVPTICSGSASPRNLLAEHDPSHSNLFTTAAYSSRLPLQLPSSNVDAVESKVNEILDLLRRNKL
jgi:hypothetical protein